MTRFLLTVGMVAMLVSCGNDEFRGKPGKQKRERQASQRPQALPSKSYTPQIANGGLELKAPAKISLQKVCSISETRKYGTNLERATAGVGLKIYPAPEQKVKVAQPSREYGAPISITDNPLERREEMMRDGTISLSGHEGTFHVIVCDINMMDSCELSIYSHKWGPRFFGTNGFIGSGGFVKLTAGEQANNGMRIVMSDTGFSNLAGSGETGETYDSDCDSQDSPLLFDFAGDAGRLSSKVEGVRFDIKADGAKNLISWPVDTAQNGFLALDANDNGLIDHGGELFGNHSIGPDGQTSANGFLALAKYDLNNDQIIDASDPVYHSLVIWRDALRDGISQPNELVSLASAGIDSIDLRYAEGDDYDAWGNSAKQRSWASLANGDLVRVFDIWFHTGVSR